MSNIKKTATHASIYMVGVLIGRLVSFIMLPIYTRNLTPSDYGILELLTMTVDIVAVVVGVGISNGIFKFYYDYDTKADKNVVISTAFMLVILLYSIATIICILNSNYFAALLFDGRYSLAVSLVFGAMFFQICIQIPMVYLRARQRPFLFVTISFLRLIVQLSLNIYFIVYLKKGVMGAVWAEFFTTILFGIILSSLTFKEVGINFHKDKARKLIRFGAPFIITNIGAFILTFSDRYFLKMFCDLKDVGIYSLGYKIGFLLSFLVSRPFNNIWEAQRFEVIKQKNYIETFNQMLLGYSVVLFTTGLCLSLFSRDLFRIMSSPEYLYAYKVVPIIVLAYVVQGLTGFFNFGNYYKGKSMNITYGTFLAVAIILILSFALIPKYYTLGAAVATLIAFLFRLAYIYYSSQKEFKMNYNLARVFFTLLPAILIYTTYHFSIKRFIFLDNIFYSLFFSCVLLLIYIILLLVLKIIPVQYFLLAKEKILMKKSNG